MLRNVHLHGRLGLEFGEMHCFDVSTAGEAIRALVANFPPFLKAIQEGAYRIVRGELKDEAFHLDESNVNTFNLGNADLHIVPYLEGSKNTQAGGTLKVILGGALIGAAVLFSGGALATPIAGGLLGAFSYGNIAIAGLALAVAGVATLLAPQWQDPNEQASFTLSGPGNSYAQGNPVPLVYGEVITGSQLVSGSLDIEQIPVNWDPTNGNTSIDTFDPETGQGIVSGNAGSYTQPSGYT